MARITLKSDLKFDVLLAKKAVRFLQPILKYYFRGEVLNFEKIPRKQTILIANHDGGMLPLDALLFLSTWHRHFRFKRRVYVLIHDIIFKMFGPWKHLLYQLGCLPADKKNLDAVLDRGYDLLIYPGGARETFRSFWDRKKITLGDRTGFICHALRKKVLITPLVSVGGHETLFILSTGSWLAHKLGLYKYLRADVFPLVAGLPFGIWLGAGIPHFPLPAKITMKVLPSVDLYQKAKKILKVKKLPSKNSRLVHQLFLELREKMQRELNELYAKRSLPIIG